MDYKEIAKKFFIPGYGLYKEIQKPKKDRNLLWAAGFGIQTLWLGAKLALTPFYISNGIKTNEWNFFDYVKKDVIGLTYGEKKNLEKTIVLENEEFH